MLFSFIPWCDRETISVLLATSGLLFVLVFMLVHHVQVTEPRILLGSMLLVLGNGAFDQGLRFLDGSFLMTLHILLTGLMFLVFIQKVSTPDGPSRFLSQRRWSLPLAGCWFLTLLGGIGYDLVHGQPLT